MASSLLAKLLILTTLVTISVISRANEELMMQQCHNSDNPTLCLRCLNSDPTSPEADNVGVARIILRCVNSHLLTLTNNTSALASKHHRNPKAAAALKQCGLGYAMAKRGVGEADAHLIAGDYDKAAYDVSATVEAPPVTCRASLVTLGINLPSSFRYHTEVYLALTQALLRIIDRF
ncbi:hypothetical protein EUTSA_v10022116mg [Eutrema salsugineum]|uniref:Pectinesterase inhibitor domain-containing protein n=1 Tax=Eutrema salsugineum TaxID=72664 RepID=V4LY03_EUTSA|nr:uncharacterized protein LOC18025077 [Eutrema salsugineum]ESQ48739.1 hypothetical protein EUTSA_v10022116mg [Eutrema salsugineum]